MIKRIMAGRKNPSPHNRPVIVRDPTPRRWLARTFVVILLVATGCSRKPRNFLYETDQLRKDNLDLQRQIEGLENAIALRLEEIHRLEQQVSGSRQRIEGARIPQVTALRFDRYTGAIDANDDGMDDTVRVYLKTLDQQGHFIPVAGRAVVQAVLIQPGRVATVLNETTYEPQAFSAAYRCGLTGTHYTLELDLPSPPTAEAGQITLKLTFTDAATGVQLSHEMSLQINQGQLVE